MDQTALFYSRPSHEFRGGAFNVFTGARRQRGGGIFGALKNFFLPIAKNLGRSLFSTGVGLASDLARDTMEGKNFKKSLMERGKSRALDFGKSAAREGISTLSKMVGRGRRRRKRVKRISKRRRKSVKRRPSRRAVSRKPTSRKRRATSKSSHKRKAKRRRVNF